MKTLLRRLVACLLVTSAPAFAADDKLVAGSNAPTLVPRVMVRGEAPNLRAERGCALVVFWRSSEAQSKQAVSAVNRAFVESAPRGLQLIWVSEEDEETVRKAMTGGDAAPKGALASDKDGASKNEWLAAAKLETLPRAFVVARGGRVIWIGSPLQEEFATVVRKTMGGRYDPASRAKIEPAIRAAQKCAEVRNFAEAYKHWGEAIDGDPGLALDAVQERFKTTLLKEGNAAAANAWIVDVAKKRYAGDQAALVDIVEMLVKDPEVTPRSLETAEQVVECMGAKTGVPSMTMQALLASARGDLRKAVDLQTDAWMAASAFDKPDLKRALDEYRAAAKRQPAAGAKGGG
jgi:hypothetical protein